MEAAGSRDGWNAERSAKLEGGSIRKRYRMLCRDHRVLGSCSPGAVVPGKEQPDALANAFLIDSRSYRFDGSGSILIRDLKLASGQSQKVP